MNAGDIAPVASVLTFLLGMAAASLVLLLFLLVELIKKLQSIAEAYPVWSMGNNIVDSVTELRQSVDRISGSIQQKQQFGEGEGRWRS